MTIKSISLQNFRSHSQIAINLSPDVNILVGKNGKGKTNLLEAVYFTCVGRGFRSPRDREAIKFGQAFSRIKTTAEKRFGDISVEIVLLNEGKKQIKINEIPIAKMGELMGSVTCVFFSPDEMRLIKEAPADRRRFMDIAISQIDKKYFYNLLRYNKILQQRNALLKQTAPELQVLDIIDGQLATTGVEIVVARLKFIDLLKKYVGNVHSELTDKKEKIEIKYSTSLFLSPSLPSAASAKTQAICGIDNMNITPKGFGITTIAQTAPAVSSGIEDFNKMFHVEHSSDGSVSSVQPFERATPPASSTAQCSTWNNLTKRFSAALLSVREKDLRLRTTTFGPHRDDLLLDINGKDVRAYASQGQQRSAALSLKLAELKVFEELTNEKPVLLLDDVFSELDDSRQSKLLSLIKDCQSIITATQFDNVNNIKCKMFHVEHFNRKTPRQHS